MYKRQVGLELKVSFKAIAAGLVRFYGAKRRFEIKGSYKGATVVDDYAHHLSLIHISVCGKAERFGSQVGDRRGIEV